MREAVDGLEDQVLRAAEDAFARVMAGVPEQVETMPPDLDLADTIRWAGDRVTELLASLSELPLEDLLGLEDRAAAKDPSQGAGQPRTGQNANGQNANGQGQPSAGEPLQARAAAGQLAEARIWVHPVGELAPGELRFLLSDLVTATGELIAGTSAGFTPARLTTPVAVGAATLLRLPVPAGSAPGCYHGHVFAHGATGAAVPITVTVS